MKKFTLYLKTGDKHVVEGKDITQATTQAGYGQEAISALDFYSEGVNKDWEWIDQKWEMKCYYNLTALIPTSESKFKLFQYTFRGIEQNVILQSQKIIESLQKEHLNLYSVQLFKRTEYATDFVWEEVQN